jgi:hypothetical protein
MAEKRKRERAPRAPFPWRVQRRRAGVYTVVDRDGKAVTGQQVAQSNAWLIAAAPDLLAACKAAYDLLGDADAETTGDVYVQLARAIRFAETLDDPQL